MRQACGLDAPARPRATPVGFDGFDKLTAGKLSPGRGSAAGPSRCRVSESHGVLRAGSLQV